MEIERKMNCVEFGDLDIGDTFEWLETIYMKTECLKSEDNDICGNAIALGGSAECYLEKFEDDSEVIKADFRLVEI